MITAFYCCLLETAVLFFHSIIPSHDTTQCNADLISTRLPALHSFFFCSLILLRPSYLFISLPKLTASSPNTVLSSFKLSFRPLQIAASKSPSQSQSQLESEISC